MIVLSKFKVGDKVRVVNITDDYYTDALGAVGTIVDVDEEWLNPYEVYFGEGLKFRQELFAECELVLDSEPTGLPQTEYINIKFQEGAIVDNGVNGCQIEDVIDTLVERLNGFQKGNFACRENALAITKLEEARMWLTERTRKRKEQGVEGIYINHK